MGVVGLSQSAPQSSQQQVIGQVISQLQPTIARTLSQFLIGNRASSIAGTTSSGLDQAVTSSSYGQGATSAVRTSSSSSQASQGFTSFGQGATGAVRTSSISSQSGLNEAQLTSSVVASLQPSIAAAVAEALRSRSKPATTFGQSSSSGSVSSSVNTLTEEEEAEINAQLSAGVQYEYGYKVADDDAQAYMAHEEMRNGQNVEGKYNYVDANGALVTVTYQAGPDGYTENREVQDGAVQMRNIPGPWEGPYADTVPAGVSAEGVTQSSSISARGQAEIIQRILQQIQPQIAGAVQSAIAGNTENTGSTAGVFSGDNSVRIQTPEFNIAY